MCHQRSPCRLRVNPKVQKERSAARYQSADTRSNGAAHGGPGTSGGARTGGCGAGRGVRGRFFAIPDTEDFYRGAIADSGAAPVRGVGGRFRTAPEATKEFRFAWSADMEAGHQPFRLFT